MIDRHNRKTKRNQESNESTMKGEVVERKDLSSLRECLEWKGKQNLFMQQRDVKFGNKHYENQDLCLLT